MELSGVDDAAVGGGGSGAPELHWGLGRAELASDMLALVVAGGREGGGAAGTAAGRAEGGRGELSRMKLGLALAPQVGTPGTLEIDDLFASPWDVPWETPWDIPEISYRISQGISIDVPWDVP